MKKLKEVLPDFCDEIEAELVRIGRRDVRDQLDVLTLERHTIDDSVGAMCLYVGGVRELNDVERNIIGVKHGECLPLSEVPGMVVVDLDNFERVMGIEILDRSDIVSKLRN